MLKVKIFSQQNDLTDSAVFETVAECNQWVADCTPYFPANYRVEVIDVTQAYADLNLVEQAAPAQAIGLKARALVWGINAQKAATMEQIQALLYDRTILMAERLLENGALATAKTVIGMIDEKYFTAAEKARVIKFIDVLGNL